ncbi:hypothetical protein [Paenibacillus dokdonensis]|nr:hypothetical protein [Paenibacillus dokdonensis]
MSGHKEIIHKSGSNGLVPQDDAIINVTVEWEDTEEELQLSSNGKH